MPVKDPTCLLISCLCLIIGPVLTVNKRCIYVNERESTCSPMLERIVFSTKYISWKTDRQTGVMFILKYWGFPTWKTTQAFFFFFCTTNTNFLLKQNFHLAKKAIFSGSAGKHSAWRRSWIPKGFSAVGFFPSNMSVHLTTSRHLHLETFILLL